MELELIARRHLIGLTAGKSVIDAKQEQGQLTITCAEKLAGHFNMPVIVRATLILGGERLVAEVKLDVQP